MRIRNLVGLLAVAGGAVAAATVVTAGSVSAASATANLAVSATVTNNCTISTGALAFGTYDPVVTHDSANLDGTGSVTVACTKGTAPTIGLGNGANASGSIRRMHDGSSNYLSYELYQDTGRTTAWRNTGAGLLSPVAAPSKASRTFTVYGRVTGNQDVPAGTYTDTVLATVNF